MTAAGLQGPGGLQCINQSCCSTEQQSVLVVYKVLVVCSPDGLQSWWSTESWWSTVLMVYSPGGLQCPGGLQSLGGLQS